MAGIVSCGAYAPRYRLKREKIFTAMGWMNPANRANARGDKAVANFDEDSLTMAVAAGRQALAGLDRAEVGGVYFASTTMPYKERLNAGIICGALGLTDQVRAADFSGGLKAGTSALLAALEGVEAKRLNNLVVCAADCRLGAPASVQEMVFGDAAAAAVVGSENVIAELRGSFSTTHDFVDHYRGQAAVFDRQWEDRWIRDQGYGLMIPEAVRGLLAAAGLDLTAFSKVIYPCRYGAERKRINKLLGITPEMDQSTLLAEIGECGTPQPLVMLAAALEEAQPGDRILVVGFGNGCDAIHLQVTDRIKTGRGGTGLSGSLANKAELDSYEKYLVWRNILPGDLGLRAEEDLWTRWSLLWRNHKAVLGLFGSKCLKCGTVQFPPQRICVNPDCGAVDEMTDYPFADKIGRISSYTGDNLAASYNPPAIYGQVEFEEGGKFLFDFTDCDLDSLAVGQRVGFSFRRKYYDAKRDIVGYFWKAVPLKEVD